MYPKILLFMLPLALLFAAAIVIWLWDRKEKGSPPQEQADGKPEGAFRAFYHALWMLLLWSGLGLSLPLWFSFRQKIEGLPLEERWILIAKILVLPLILMVLLRYGAKRGYLRWIDGLEWPDKENR